MGWLNLPNLLSLARLALAPFVFAAVVAGRHWTALAILAAAATTDAIDGPLARRMHCVTRWGAYLDPIADKVLLSASYVALGIAGLVPWWLVGLVFGRDLLILVLAGGALLVTGRREFPPSVWGKLSTGVQALVAVLVLAGACEEALLWAVAAVTLWSGMHYLWRACHLPTAHTIARN